jgi:hypothetical protein
MEGCAFHIKPGLAFGMAYPQVTIMASRRTIAIKTAGGMTLGTNCRCICEVSRVMGDCAMRPGPLIWGIFVSSWAKMAL